MILSTFACFASDSFCTYLQFLVLVSFLLKSKIWIKTFFKWCYFRHRIFLFAFTITLNIAAKLTLIILFSTVKSKSWVFENMFSNASNIFLHKLYYNISQLFLEILKSKHCRTFFWQILLWLCNILEVEQFLFIVSTWVKRLTVLVCSKMKKEKAKEN